MYTDFQIQAIPDLIHSIQRLQISWSRENANDLRLPHFPLLPGCPAKPHFLIFMHLGEGTGLSSGQESVGGSDVRPLPVF